MCQVRTTETKQTRQACEPAPPSAPSGQAEAVRTSFSPRDYSRFLNGRGAVCIPASFQADVPRPSETVIREAWNGLINGGGQEAVRTGLTLDDSRYQDYFGLPQGLNCELIPEEEIRNLWNQTLEQSNQQVHKQRCQQQTREDRAKTEKLEMLLLLALNSGDMDLAMLLFSSLESKQANDLSKTLLQRLQDLQSQKRGLSEQIAGLGSESKEDAKKANDLSLKIGDIGTEINMLQAFLQEAMAHKNEAQSMASNFLKGRHEVGMSIARNIG